MFFFLQACTLWVSDFSPCTSFLFFFFLVLEKNQRCSENWCFCRLVFFSLASYQLIIARSVISPDIYYTCVFISRCVTKSRCRLLDSGFSEAIRTDVCHLIASVLLIYTHTRTTYPVVCIQTPKSIFSSRVNYRLERATQYTYSDDVNNALKTQSA